MTGNHVDPQYVYEKEFTPESEVRPPQPIMMCNTCYALVPGIYTYSHYVWHQK